MLCQGLGVLLKREKGKPGVFMRGFCVFEYAEKPVPGRGCHIFDFEPPDDEKAAFFLCRENKPNRPS